MTKMNEHYNDEQAHLKAEQEITSLIGDINKIDLSYVKPNENKVYLLLVCVCHIDGSPQIQKALLDKMEGYIGHITSDWFRNEYPGMQPVTVITFKEEPDELILQLLSKCIPWFNEYGIDLRFQLNDEYFRISVSKG